MIVGNPLFPLPTSYYGVSRLNDQLDTLQQQLASGDKASTLADLGSIRYTDLTVRARLGRMTGYDTNIGTVNMRIDMMNQVLTAVGTVNSNTNTASVPSSYGTDYVNFATAPTTASASLTQVLTALNTDLNGHYLFGGSSVDKAPVASVDAIMNGSDGKAGFLTVADQRLQADQGVNEMGRLSYVTSPTVSSASAGTMTLTDGSAPAATLQAVTSTSAAVTISGQPATTSPAAPGTFSVAFSGPPADGDQITVQTRQPDGTTGSVTLTATTGPTAGPGQFLIGADATESAANFQSALQTSLGPANTVGLADDVSPFGMKLMTVTSSNSAAIGTSLTAGSSGPPATPGQMSVSFNYDATATPPVAPKAGDTVSVQVQLPDGTTDTMTLTAVSATDATINGVATVRPGEFLLGTDGASTAANFQSALTNTIQNESQSTLVAASNFAASSDFFTSAADSNTGPRRIDLSSSAGGSYATAMGYESAADAANDTVQWYTGGNAAEADARATVTTKVDDTISVNYGAQANEFGFTQLIRSLAVQSISNYSTDTTVASGANESGLDRSKAQYDAVAARVNTNLSTLQNGKQGSIAAMGVDLGLTQTTLKNVSDRHSGYSAQLQTVLSDAEDADPNEVASQLLDLQTRLSASYSAISMLSQLQLSYYLK